MLKKILYIIHLPPPFHGVSTVNKIVFDCENINKNFSKKLIRINYSNNLNEIGKTSFNKFVTFFKLLYQVARNLVSFKPEYVYFTIMPYGVGFIRDSFLVVLIKLFNVKIIYHLHGNGISDVKNIFIKKLYKFVFSRSSIIHLSQGLVDKEITPLNLYKSKVYVVPNGVLDLKQKKIGVKNNIPKILFLSNYSESKGLFVLIESARLLKLKNIKFHLRIVGEPYNVDKEKINYLLNKYDLLENITFPGPKYESDKHKEFCNADIFVFPSLNDTFPLVLIEAMKYSLPIVGSIEGAIPEIIDDGNTGFTVPKHDFESLADKLEILIKDDSLRAEMGINANQEFKEKYNLEKFENNMILTFRKILKCVE
jgi:glycosyltransferase involved in cell wall biosynthesis